MQQLRLDFFGRLLADRSAALVTERFAQAGHQQPQVIVNFGDRGHRAARIRLPGTLIDRYRRLQALDQIDIGPLHLVQKLPRVDRKAFDVLPLPFGENRIEGQRAFARAAGAGNDDQLVARQIDIEILKIVHPGATNLDEFAVRGRRRAGGNRDIAIRVLALHRLAR